MAEVYRIYGTDVTIPDEPPIEEIENWGTNNPKEQYWRRKPLNMPAI